MRFLIAAVLFVGSLVTSLLGIGDRTIWAPPADHHVSLTLTSNAPFVVVPASVLAEHSGNPVITVKSKNPTSPVFVSYGRESDIRAWLGSAHFVELQTDKTAAGVATVTQGLDRIGLRGVNPNGSDLWVDSRSGNGLVSIQASAAAGTGALIAADGALPTPTELKFVWGIKHDLTYSNTMLYIGAGLFVAAVVMLIIASRHKRVKRGPRRRTPKAPRAKRIRVKANKELTKGRGRRSVRRNPLGKIASRVASVSLVLVTSAALTGCTIQWPGVTSGANPSASPSVESSANTASPAVLTRTQLERIIKDVSAVAANGDKANNRSLITSRFAGPAFQIRAVNYALRKKSSRVDALQPIAPRAITFSLPAASDVWPRTVMAVTDEPGQAVPPQLVVLQQASPRDNYKVWYVSRLLPGIKIPATPTETVGAIPVDAKSVFIKLAPNQLAAAFGDVINKGKASLSAGLFDLTNPFYTQVSSEQKAQVESLENAKVTFKHSLGEANVLSLATADAGALVATYMLDTYVIKPNRAGAAVAVEGQEKILLGTGGSTSGVQSVYGDMLLFYVPPVTSKDEIQLLGVTQGLVSIKKL